MKKCFNITYLIFNFIVFIELFERHNRNAKRGYISSSSSANIWQFLGTSSIGRQRHADFPKSVDLDDINRYFTTTTTLDYQNKVQTMQCVARLSRPNINPFDFSPIAPEEVKQFIMSINQNNISSSVIMVLIIKGKGVMLESNLNKFFS